jgi:hypothetical protein
MDEGIALQGRDQAFDQVKHQLLPIVVREAIGLA